MWEELAFIAGMLLLVFLFGRGHELFDAIIERIRPDRKKGDE